MMNTRIERVHLGQEGIAYLEARLTDGHTLSHYLLPELRSFRDAYTFLPRGTDPVSLTDFESGGKLPGGLPMKDERVVPIPNTDALLSDLIRAHLDAAVGNACIFENALAQRDDPVLANRRGVFFFEREVYHYRVSPEEQEGTIESTVRAAHSLISQMVGVLTKSSLPRTELDRADVSSDVLQRFALETRVIIASAYDGESWVMAERWS